MQTIIPDNAQDIGARAQQQDSFCFSNPDDDAQVAHHGLLAVVADGMGGMALGQEASRIACRVALEVYDRPATSVFNMLDAILVEATHAVYRRAEEAGLAGEVGTTIVIAAIYEGALYWRSVGDSRIYLFRNGHLACLTADHIHGRDLLHAVGQGTLPRDIALADPEFGALTSFIGLSELHEVDGNIRPFPLYVGDRVLLCSDGLYNTLSEAAIESYLRAKSAGKAAQALVQAAVIEQKRDQDNISVSLLDLPPLTISYPDESPTVRSPKRSLGIASLGTTKGESRRSLGWWGIRIGGITMLAALFLFALQWGMGTQPDPASETATSTDSMQVAPSTPMDSSDAPSLDSSSAPELADAPNPADSLLEPDQPAQIDAPAGDSGQASRPDDETSVQQAISEARQDSLLPQDSPNPTPTNGDAVPIEPSPADTTGLTPPVTPADEAPPDSTSLPK